MSIEYFKSRAVTLKNLLAQQNIEIGHSQALEILAKFYGHKNWDTLSGVFKHKPDLELLVVADNTDSSPDIIRLLKNGLLPFKISYLDLRNVRFIDDGWSCVHPDDLEVFITDSDKYYQFKEAHKEKLRKEATMAEFGLSEQDYDHYEKLKQNECCLGKNKNGNPCKVSIYSRYMREYTVLGFIKYFYHPNHFCKSHKNQIPEHEKKKLFYILKEEWPAYRFYAAAIARELDISLHTAKKWLKENIT